MKESTLREYIRKIIREMSVTANVASYSTPKAFNKDEDAEGSEAFDDPEPATAYFEKPPKRGKTKTFDVVSLHEISYRDFKNDNTKTPTQKVNLAIGEINQKLAEVNKILNHSIRLKTESGVTSSGYWKRTTSNITKISEKVNIINNKLKKLSE